MYVHQLPLSRPIGPQVVSVQPGEKPGTERRQHVYPTTALVLPVRAAGYLDDYFGR